MQTVFETAGGNDGLRRLAGAWHRRVIADDMVGHAFSHGFHPQHVERLAAYWAEALGGPTTYSDSYGDETTVVKMHSGNGEHDEMDRRAIACFDQALADVGLADNGALRQVLHDYFAWATTKTMSRYHQSADDVPNGLSIPLFAPNALVASSKASPGSRLLEMIETFIYLFPFLSRKASRIVSSNQTQLTDKSYMGSPVALLPGS